MNKRTRILVVDDDDQNLSLIKSELEKLYIVKTCLNGNIALSVLMDFDPAVILLDWNMPGIDGLSLLKIIKANEKTKNILVVMMTGYLTEQNDLLLAYNSGVIDFIRKPFDMLELKARVNSVAQLYLSFKREIEIKDKELVTSAMRLVENGEYINDLIGQVENLVYEETNLATIRVKIGQIKNQFDTRGSDQQWNQFYLNFKNVYPGFIKSLIYAHPHLTVGEVKLCTLIKLNLSSKQISAITNTTIESVKVSRARLRKKMGLGAESNLAGYLMGF